MQKGRGSLAPCWFGVSPKVTFSRPHCKKRSNPARHSEWEGLLRLMKGSFRCVFPCSVSNSSNHDLDVKLEQLLQSNILGSEKLATLNLLC